jgi:homoserine dehydrogenase
MAFQNVFILGASGQVGTEVVKQIWAVDGVNRGHQNPTRIVGIANSTRFQLSPGGIMMPEVITRDSMRSLLSEENRTQSYDSHQQILEAVRTMGMEWEIVFVDVTADGQTMIDFHKDVIRSTTNRIVTANKKPAAADMGTFKAITGNPQRYGYNTTVMAWAGTVPYLQNIHWLSETLELVEGTFSGTLAYVCSELEKWEKNFSQIVREARDLGYTEPHPIDDLNGEDVRRKLLILLRSAGVHIEEEEVELSGLVDPKTYEGMSADEFLDAIKSEDIRIAQEVQDALSRWLVPRYIASYGDKNGKMQASVWLQYVAKNSELWNLKWTANKVLVNTSVQTPLWSTPHIIQSPGAWVLKTAAAVRSDLFKFLNNTNLWAHN